MFAGLSTPVLYPRVNTKSIPVGNLLLGKCDLIIPRMDKYEHRRRRLIELRDTKCNGKAVEVARAIGREPSYVSRMLYPEGKAGKKRIADDMMEVIEKAFGLPRGWLDYEEQPDLGPAIQTPLRPVVVVDSADDINPDHDIFSIPRYTVRASAGDGEPVFEIDTKGTPNYCRGGWALENGYKRDKLFSIVARGNSMEPTIPNGASLIVHRQEEVVSGKVHVICRGDECYVKRLIRQLDGSVLVKSENPDYKDVEVLPDDPTPLHVVGLVVSVSFNL